VRIGGAEKRGDVVLLAGIEPARHDRAALGFDRGDQRRKLVGIAPPDKNGEAFGGEFLRYRRTDEISPAPITAAVALRLLNNAPPENPDAWCTTDRAANGFAHCRRSRRRC